MPVKAKFYPFCAACFLTFLLSTSTSFAQTQGKVVINEYLPWTSNSCGVGSEYVELLNFGPGPVNIGCYIVTTGVYSVTIPPNTILMPGQFYVLAGKDVIGGTCANVDSSAAGGIHANLNWNTCNCTNTPIPSTSTSEGMMADDGYSPVALLDPSLNVIDAVVRGLPTKPTTTITTSSVNGACASKTFNLGSMGISYETLGMAPGNQNSFARSMDGDCVWLKQPNVSGNASNNKSGKGTDISYEFDMINPTSCEESGTGSVSIYVKHSDYASVFPMSYTISQDTNNDGVFDFTDQYNTYYDYSPPFIEIDDLPVGHFKVTVASAKGCYLANFEFTIINCFPTSTLPLKLVYFKNAGAKTGQNQLEWLLQDVQNLQSVVVEKSADGAKFETERVFVNTNDRGDKQYTAPVATGSAFRYYRLKITGKNGRSFYSPVVNTGTGATPGLARFWPNPAVDRINVEFNDSPAQAMAYTIYNTTGLPVSKGVLSLPGSDRSANIALPASLPPGAYHLHLSGTTGSGQPISFRFVKH